MCKILLQIIIEEPKGVQHGARNDKIELLGPEEKDSAPEEETLHPRTPRLLQTPNAGRFVNDVRQMLDVFCCDCEKLFAHMFGDQDILFKRKAMK